jgi:ABC-2 type transport system permease protein
MNFRGGLALIKKSLLGYMSSRGFFWTLSVAWMMGPLIYLFVWITAAGQGTIKGFNRDDFVFYYLVLILVNQLTYPTSNWTIGEGIRNGTIATWLLRPIPTIFEAIASDIAVKIVCMPFVLVIAVGLALFLSISIHIPAITILIFLFSLAMAQILRFIFAYVMALMAFWTQRIDALLDLSGLMVFLFAGQVAPTMLLPGILKNAALVLPFRYMLGFPIEVLMGKLDRPELITGLIIQAVWVVCLLVLHWIVWQRGLRKFSSIGG